MNITKFKKRKEKDKKSLGMDCQSLASSHYSMTNPVQ